MRISFSSFETYQQCPLKYKFQEIDRIPSPKSKEQVFGTVIHGTLKYIHDPATTSPTLEQALDYFSRNWNSDVYGDDEIGERSAFSQGVDIIRRYYDSGEADQKIIVDLESRFQYEIGSIDSRHTVSGIIDRIDKTASGWEIIDYKTARKMPSQDQVDANVQLSVYLRAFLERYPKERNRLDLITVSLHFLRHGVRLSSTRSTEQLNEGEERFLLTIENIQAGKFEPVVSPLCDWCSFQKQCPMWRHKYRNERKIDSAEIQESIQEYIDLKAAISKTKYRMMELQNSILRYMSQEGVDRVFGEAGILSRSAKKTYEYDTDIIRSILEPLDKWDSVRKIDSIALNRLVKSLPEGIKRKIEEAKKIKRETQAISVKKTKGLDDEENPGDDLSGE